MCAPIEDGTDMAPKKTGFIVGAVAGAGVAAAALAGVGLRLPEASADNAKPRLIQVSGPAVFAPPPGAPLSFADIFDKVSPAVVSINVTSKVERQRGIPGFENFPFDLQPRGKGGPGGQGDGHGGQDDGGGDQGGGKDDDSNTAMASGSGFFISPDGYVVTNNHVVENATDIKVVLKDERELPAKVVGRDEDTDLAVIKVEGKNFPFVNFENSARPRVGDWVIAVGNPFGLGGTATAGIVSAYGRNIGDTFIDYMQIDAPINRGNSGGPTFDVYGRVIGVNTAIFSPSGGSVGIGFAIPADIADNITKQLISGVKITRGYLGATIQAVTPEIADSLGISGKKGALVAELVPGGPAQKAGVMSGDVVLQVNGHSVKDSTDLTRQVAASHTGDMLNLTILRAGKDITVSVKSGVRPSKAELDRQQNADSNDRSSTPDTPAAKPNALGLSMGPLDDAARHRYGLPSDVSGAVVEGVATTSDAAKKGVKRGDVVVRAGDRAVSTAADLNAAIDAQRKAGRTSILVFIFREGRQLGVPLKIEDGKAPAK
jgi:serine protease Do